MAQAQPLSYGQERLWFLHRLDPEDHSYNTCHAYRLRGDLDVGRLERAFTAVVARHETLRTRFEEIDGRPVAIVLPPEPVTLERFETDGEDEARRLVARRANTPFDLSAAPPVRITLVRIAPRDHVLAVAQHHIVADGISVAVLRDELAHHYGGGDPLPPLPLQYGEHARAERAADDGADLEFWTTRLAGAPALELPPDRPRPPRRTGNGGEIRFTLPPGLAARVAAFARERRCTPFMVLLTAYQVLLHRHSGQTDFCVGSPVSGRDRTELEPMIGFLSSTLVLRADLSGEPTFGEALTRTRRTVIEAMGHAGIPLERLLGALDIARDLSRTPLFQTIFGLHAQSGEHSEGPLPGLRAEPFPPGWIAARTDLSLDLWPTEDGGYLGVLIYGTDLFDRDTAARLAARFETLLDSALSAPDRPVGTLGILPGAERRALLAHDTETPLPPVTLVDLFLDQVARRPDAVAVGPADGGLTYAGLAARARGLAVRLRDRGIGPGSLVALRLDRGPEMLVALLGVAMSGAAYLPVDPAYPPARVAYVIEDSGASLVLTTADLADVPPSDEEVPRPRPRNTAYVLYTSGSTGRPKGVVVPHRALVNFLLAMRPFAGNAPGQTWLALTSLAFDISTLEIYMPLITGGRVVVADDARDGHALAALIADQGVTHVQATPSGWRVLLAGKALDHARITAFAGGEPLPLQLARELRAGAVRLVNVYGPTETTVYSTAWDVPPEPHEISIGRPVANTTTYVLDPAGDLAPIGVPGELVIGGAGVATGYLGRPALTAERFTPDPYGPPGGRLYRTGDVARRRADGTIEFLGRADNQVKIRGHRVELGEVEAVLETHPAVRQAVAVARGGELVAFVVADGDISGLAAHAATELPGPMVPRVLVLDTLPLTPNGKVDRAALPDAEPVATVDTTPPRTPAERLVADVFAEVLGLDAVGAHDDFFALGGHSLLATMVTARLPVRIPVREVFARPTVAGLAELLDAGQAGPGDVPRPRGGIDAPLSAGQERLWFLNRLDRDGDAAFNMWLVRRLRGPLDTGALERAFTEVAGRHESLRTRFPDVDGDPVAVIEPAGPVPVERLDADGEPRAAALVADRVNTPFDLAAGPPLRVTLIRLSSEDHVLCVVMHHVIGDGWSLNLLLDELADAYSGRPLPPVPLQFGDVAVWQRGRDLTGLLEYWHDRLADPTPLDLPADRPRTTAGPGRAERVSFRLPAADADALSAMGRRRGATLFMTLVAAYQALLARHTGRTDILVGTSVAGRDTVELESVVGYLTDVLVLRGDLAGDPTFAGLLGETRRRVLDAFAHQGIPFEQLVASLGLERDLTRTPVFQTMAILHTQDAGRVPRSFHGLAAGHFPGGHDRAKFELMLEAWHDDGDLLVELEYDSALFDAETVAALAARLEVLLRDVAADPDRPLSALPMLTGADRDFLRSASHGPALPATPPVPALIAESVRTRPGAVAIGCGGREVTYRELDGLAEASATEIRAAGIPEGGIAAVPAERSPETVAALLGAWRAGAAYLPVDPALPRGRRDLMAAEIDGVAADGAAYVVYTSGSTGTPKGVIVDHDGLAARVAWMRDDYGLGPADHVVQFAALGFDAHAEEIFPALASGARLELLPDGAVTLPDLLRTPSGQRVTVLDLPTAYWHHLVGRLDEVAWPPSLRLVILGGEQVQAAAVDRWRARFGDRVRLVNTYGPTEATIIATAADLTGFGTGERPPIGRPVGGVTAVVLSEHGVPVPPGAPGELYLGGAGVARGYLRRPGGTAERFVPDPWGPPGARLYRTGDRARWRRDGQLEFLGRLDDQVKVRGFRVEPAEVEACLLGHPRVRQAAVAAGDDRLVAYVVPEGEVDPAELARFAAAELPAHLVPSGWIVLEALPLTRNGKVDRAALPAPAAEEFTRRSGPVPPRTDAEALVADVYGEVLGLGEVGAFDDFFSIGGHSLLAIRVTARISAITGVEVPIRAVFEGPTVEALAETVEELLVKELAALSDEEAARLAMEAM
ncbi:amino acid adenylation domain-containing protein [Microbispora sp. CA-102843]|uniref:amino acid adenylation domain-containing protein n=1 Tax=Microbispora sp. CA-102843 TaxID=3239952 RepID=UPI003D8D0A7A